MAPHPELVARWKEKLAAHMGDRNPADITYGPVAWYNARECKIMKEAKILGLTYREYTRYLKVLFPNVSRVSYQFGKRDW